MHFDIKIVIYICVHTYRHNRAYTKEVILKCSSCNCPSTSTVFESASPRPTAVLHSVSLEHGQPFKRSSLMRDVVVETGFCEDVSTTVSDFLLFSCQSPIRLFNFHATGH